MKTEAILEELEYLEPGHFPREALKAAIAQQESITPYLLRTLEDAPSLLEQMEDDADYMLPFYASFLLAQFRETRAYPLKVGRTHTSAKQRNRPRRSAIRSSLLAHQRYHRRDGGLGLLPSSSFPAR